MEIPNQLMGTAIVVLDGQKVLLGKRKNSYKSGWYGIPGGRVEEKERIIDCAIRELKEETGIKTNRLEYIGVVRDQNVGYSFIHFGFVYKYNEETVKLTEPEKCEKWEWFDLDKIPTNTLPGHAAIIDMVKDQCTSEYREVSSV